MRKVNREQNQENVRKVNREQKAHEDMSLEGRARPGLATALARKECPRNA